jgi:thioredoxin 1
MKARIAVLFMTGLLLLWAGTSHGHDIEAKAFDTLPVTGTVTLIDLGATACIPCKMMAPILKKLEKKYDGKATIVFIDVWKDRSQARRFKIRAIPTQIFFDKEGKEVFRHVGFMSEDAIVQQLKKMGVD